MCFVQYLSATKHDPQHISLHNVDQLCICVVTKNTILVTIGTSIVNPATVTTVIMQQLNHSCYFLVLDWKPGIYASCLQL